MKFEQLKIWYRVRARGFWSVCIFAALSLTGLLALPAAKGNPIVGPSYDFATGPQGWTAQAVGKNGQLPPTTNGKRWTHGSGQWSVNWSPVSSPFVATGNYLTSPAINFVDEDGNPKPIDGLRISLAHKFNFSSSISNVPPAAGQLAYSINGGEFIALPASAFLTGSITTPQPLFGLSPLGPYVGQTTLVAPTFVPPAGGYSDLFPLINGGASFTGITPGYTNTGGTWVPSEAIFRFPETVVPNLRIRLINANLGSNCPADAGWDVRYLQVDAVAPEPGSLLLASMGGTLAAGHWLWRRRRRTINSGPPSQA